MKFMIRSMNTTNAPTTSANLAILSAEAAIAAIRVINEVLHEVDPTTSPIEVPALDPRIAVLGPVKSVLFVLATAVPLFSLVLRAGLGRAFLPFLRHLRRLHATRR